MQKIEAINLFDLQLFIINVAVSILCIDLKTLQHSAFKRKITNLLFYDVTWSQYFFFA